MSTTFGILKLKIDHDKIVDDDGDLLEYISENVFEPVFFRSMNNSRWLTHLGPYIADDIKVYALDNTQQGIFTIKDCKNLIDKENDSNSE
jgi:hypothetical protein